MALRTGQNRFTVLSSDPGEEDNTIGMADNTLPPSDPPEYDSDSSDGFRTPIYQMPSLLPLLSQGHGDSSPGRSSPTPHTPQQPRRLFRRPRSSSLPPMDSPRIPVDVSSPPKASDDSIFSPGAERRTKRQQTLVANRLQKAAKVEAEAAAEIERMRAAEQEKIAVRNEKCRKILAEMNSNEISLADLLDHVFNPENKLEADWRWQVERIFGYWSTSKYNQTTRNFIQDWAISQVAKSVYSEARRVTQSGLLSKSKKIINERFFLNFSLGDLTRALREKAPSAFAIFDAFSTTARQKAQTTPEFLKKKELMEGCAALTLLRGASQNNSYAQAVMSTYLAATGGQRQHYSVLALYGFSMGYSSTIAKTFAPKVNVSAEDGGVDDGIDDNDATSDDDESHPSRKKRRKKKKKGKKKRIRGPGLLSSLRDACMATNQALAASRKMALVYDNLNLMNRIAEQVLGRKSAQENGTCATLIPLHKAKLEHLLTSELDKSILAARPLTIDDIALDASETQTFIENMVHTILRIIVKHGGDGFAKWQKELDESQPVSPDAIDVHKTPIHPLPTMEIDESTITGNVEVIEEITKVLGLHSDGPDYLKYIQIIAGDQLTIARQRSILNVRLGHESGPHSWRHIVLMPGLFHAKIADCHGLLETHFGKPTVRSPGSLGFHNTVLDRLPITLTSLPPFRTCRDLIMVSLYARILHCLLLVSKTDSLTACAESIDSFATLVGYARQIYQTYADADRVQELRERRIPEERLRDAKAKAAKKAESEPGETTKSSLPHVHKGDMVLENGILFLRDALLTREFSDAVKAGDSGRVLVILRMWAFCYRGNGRTKYAHEMLHLLHNLICVWTKDLRYIVLQNWLANPQGKPNSFVEIDLVQEHLNFWIKKIYKADGEGHSWDWLALISPCVDILRQLATKINTDLGARQGSKHASPELAEDIQALMDSLAEHEVYTEKEGRVLDDDEKPAPDVLSVGMAALTHGSSTTPLAEFNEQFEILRRRRQLTPASDLLAGISAPTSKPEVPVDVAVDSPMTGELQDTETGYNDDMDQDSEDDSENEREDEPEEDLFAESPTLTRFDEGDVEFDMDDIPEFSLDDEEDSESDFDDEDVPTL
ncbi:hypothetical protein MSAN_01960900 [Mycena sanguinolenta]|uniref:DUF6589 domain-containing protein n=1 Tax=Mycena sanguinolenta TaxID=230812 RepID=A0A8H6XNF6_9AGAR|nr:hypothetical protein MSAN_01960900 [Mycena sanguinolenta]